MAKTDEVIVGNYYMTRKRKYKHENGKLIKVRAIEPENRIAHCSYIGSKGTFMCDYKCLEKVEGVNPKYIG